MSNEKNIEQIYDLVENFDFEDLSEEQKKLVLENMSEKEYKDMRSTISDTKNLFEKIPDNYSNKNSKSFAKILKFPMELYKVAAMIIVVFGLGLLIPGFNEKTTTLNTIDTVFVSVIDTIIYKTTDTLKIIVKEPFENNTQIAQNTENTNQNYTYSIKNDYQAQNMSISVSDLETMDNMHTKGDISQDSALSDFVVSIN